MKQGSLPLNISTVGRWDFAYFQGRWLLVSGGVRNGYPYPPPPPQKKRRFGSNDVPFLRVGDLFRLQPLIFQGCIIYVFMNIYIYRI